MPWNPGLVSQAVWTLAQPWGIWRPDASPSSLPITLPGVMGTNIPACLKGRPSLPAKTSQISYEKKSFTAKPGSQGEVRGWRTELSESGHVCRSVGRGHRGTGPWDRAGTSSVTETQPHGGYTLQVATEHQPPGAAGPSLDTRTELVRPLRPPLHPAAPGSPHEKGRVRVSPRSGDEDRAGHQQSTQGCRHILHGPPPAPRLVLSCGRAHPHEIL